MNPRRPGATAGRLAAEFLLIVVGVLVALGADAMWDRRGERAEALEYLDALEQDFAENRILLDAHVADAERIRDASIALLVTDFSAATTDSVRRHLGAALQITVFQPVLATYQDMVNSGDIRLLTNDSLRVALARFDSRVAFQKEISRWGSPTKSPS